MADLHVARLLADSWRAEEHTVTAIQARAARPAADLARTHQDRAILLHLLAAAQQAAHQAQTTSVEATAALLHADTTELAATAAVREISLERDLYEARTVLAAAAEEVTALASQVDAALLVPLRTLLAAPPGRTVLHGQQDEVARLTAELAATRAALDALQQRHDLELDPPPPRPRRSRRDVAGCTAGAGRGCAAAASAGRCVAGGG